MIQGKDILKMKKNMNMDLISDKISPKAFREVYIILTETGLIQLLPCKERRLIDANMEQSHTIDFDFTSFNETDCEKDSEELEKVIMPETIELLAYYYHTYLS